MTAASIYVLAGTILMGIGLWGVAVFPHWLRRILSVNILSVGVFLSFVAIAYRGPGEVHDPVPHAMVLTGIVVSVSATGLALALVRRLGIPEEHGGAASTAPQDYGERVD